MICRGLLAALCLAGCGDDPDAATSSGPTGASASSDDTAAASGDPPPSSTTDAATSTADPETTDAATSTADPETTGAASSTGAPPEETVDVKIVAFNDLHGNLDPPQGSAGKIALSDEMTVEAGGAAFLAAHVAALRAEHPDMIVVSAGDLIGGSPLLSALFHDEPTIEVMNTIGLDYNAVGNHEFDDGATELLRMQDGGCHPEDGCADGDPFPGASFQFLAANVLVDDEPGETLFPAYAIHEVDGVRVAFIGMTLEGTPSIVTPSGISGLTFADEAERANALVPELTAMGIEAIVVLIHEGGYQTGRFDECVGISGPIVDIVGALSEEIDLVVTGHTHQAYNCVLGGKVVTSAASFGRVLTDIDLEISAATGDVTGVTAHNTVVTRDAPDPTVEAFVATYKQLAAPLANKQIGAITGTLERYAPMMLPGLSTMGAVIADAQLAATADPMFGGAQLALMNPGGVRADLVFEAAEGEGEDGIVTYGEAFTVQPFSNNLVVMTLTGAQIEALLEQQFKDGEDPKLLQVSSGFTFAYSASAPVGAKIVPGSVALDGLELSPVESYRVTVNSFLASGGDGFTVLSEGSERLGGVTDMDALEAYFADESPVAPPALDRITPVP